MKSLPRTVALLVCLSASGAACAELIDTASPGIQALQERIEQVEADRVKVWNIADHGATPKEDCGPIINQGLLTQYKHGLIVYIPAGWWTCETTIELPNRSGVALMGAGRTNLNLVRPGMHYVGRSTVITYKGISPAVRIESEYFDLQGMNIIGERRYLTLADAEQSDEVETIGVLVTKPGRGIGTGKGLVRNVNVSGFTYGAQCGEAAGMANCDNTDWERINFVNCRAALRLCNTQAMGHHLRKIEVHNCERTIELDAGGDVHVSDANLFGSTLFHFTARHPRKWRTGANNAMVTADRIKVDTKAAGKFSVCDYERDDNGETNAAKVMVRDLMVSGTTPWKIGRVSEDMELTLSNVVTRAASASIELETLQSVTIEGGTLPSVEVVK